MSRNRLFEMHQLLAEANTDRPPAAPSPAPNGPAHTPPAAAARTATVAPAPAPATLQTDSPRLLAGSVTPNADPRSFTPIGEQQQAVVPAAVANAAEPPPPPSDRGGIPPTYYADDFVILDVGSLDAWLRDVSRLQAQIRSINRDLDQLERLQKSCMDAEFSSDYLFSDDGSGRIMSPDHTRTRSRSVSGARSPPPHAAQSIGLLGRSSTLSPEPARVSAAAENSPWKRAERIAADLQARLGVIRVKVRNLSTLRSNSLSASDQRLANVHEQMLLHHLMDVTKRFTGMQQAHAQRTREVFQRQLKIAKPDITTSELDWVISSEAAPQVFADSLLLEQERRRQVQSRHQDLVKLESSISELQQMFSDLAFLLEQQEAHVDSVALFVESGVNVLESGGRQVDEAERNARSARRKKWWLLLLLLLLGGAIAAVVLGITLPMPKRAAPRPQDGQPLLA